MQDFLLLLFAHLLNKLGENGIWVTKKLIRGSLFNNLTSTHDQNLIRVHDRLQTMGDGNRCGLSKRGANSSLQNRVRGRIETRAGFVHEKNTALAEDSAGNTNELALTKTEVRATLGKHYLQSSARNRAVSLSGLFFSLLKKTLHMALKLGYLKGGPDILIRVHMARVQVVAKRTCKHNRILRDNCNVRTKTVKANGRDVNTVNQDTSLCRFNQTQELQKESTLTTASTSYYTLLRASLDAHRNSTQDVV
mmetsp:Transcript_1429/g.3417  ORF Transcript_1429/g.3417 Transcript_1429/m.3417 type:complete len:250 (+) Transcript_1429:259-1008(+)